MVAVFRGIALGLLVVAITVHIVGFVTPNWVSAKLDMRGIQGIMSANSMGSPLLNQIGMNINMGLWKYCMKSNIGQVMQNAMAGAGQGMGGQGMPAQDSDGTANQDSDSSWQGADLDQGSNLGPSAGEMTDDSSSSIGDGMDGLSDMCRSVNASETPGWMKAVQALGIMSLIVAIVGLASILYSCFGESKGDRARLLPFIIAGICVTAGVQLLIGVAVYGTEFEKMMQDQMSMMGSASPALHDLVENIKKNTNLGYSFALDTVAGVLMLLTAVVVAIPAMKGWDSSVQFGGPRNMAV